MTTPLLAHPFAPDVVFDRLAKLTAQRWDRRPRSSRASTPLSTSCSSRARSGFPRSCRDSAPCKAEERKAIVESALDYIVTMDLDGVVRDFNPAAERNFGYRVRRRSAGASAT